MQLCNLIPDWIWPHLTGASDSEPEDKQHFTDSRTELLDEASRILYSCLAEAEERSRTVESRLVPLLTMTSVVYAFVTAGLAIIATVDMVEGHATIWVIIALIFGSYVALQLVRALWATVDGLMRRSYKQLSMADIVPEENESAGAYRIRLLNLQANYLCRNERVLNEKVSAMAVAHVALRNALTATFTVIMLGVVIAFVYLARGWGVDSEASTILLPLR